jgi:hypothetical protein
VDRGNEVHRCEAIDERYLVIVYGFPETCEPWNCKWPFAVDQCGQDRANPSVCDDYPRILHQLQKFLEWEE